MRKEEPKYPISSVDNALRLLGLFRERERVRLVEARDHLGVAQSTAHRLLAMLAHHGFVRQEADSRLYVAGPALVMGLYFVLARYWRPFSAEERNTLNRVLPRAVFVW